MKSFSVVFDANGLIKISLAHCVSVSLKFESGYPLTKYMIDDLVNFFTSQSFTKSRAIHSI